VLQGALEGEEAERGSQHVKSRGGAVSEMRSNGAVDHP